MERLMRERDDLKDQLHDNQKKTTMFITISIMQARLKMVEDIKKNRFHSQDKTKWEQTLKNFRGEGEVDHKVDENVIQENVEGQDVEGLEKGEDIAP